MDKRLKALVDSGRIPHTLIIDGATAKERLDTAKEIARSLFCESTNKPCGTCVTCKRIENDSFPDISYIVPEHGKTFISTDSLKNMVADTYMRPHESDRKLYIIPEADLIERTKQNILLKVLEEPAPNVTFILLCPSHSTFLPTILSRSAVFSLKDEAADKESEFPEESIEVAISLARALAKKSEAELIITASAFDPTSDKKFQNLKPALGYLVLIVRDALVLPNADTPALSRASAEASSLRSAFSTPELLSILEAIKKLEHSADIHGNKNLITARISSLLTTGGNT